jgi:hypothetical protein
VAGEPQRRGSGPLQDVIERLAQAGFRLLPAFEITTHYVLEREGFVALVERCPDGAFGSAGAPGLLVEGGFAALVWKAAGPVFVSKGVERPASASQIEAIRRFDTELRKALQPSGPEDAANDASGGPQG